MAMSSNKPGGAFSKLGTGGGIGDKRASKDFGSLQANFGKRFSHVLGTNDLRGLE